MSVLERSLMKESDFDPREDIIKILSYIASLSFFLIMSFTIIYLAVPEVDRGYSSLPVNHPVFNLLNPLLAFTLASINHIISYIILSIIFIASLITAGHLEKTLEEEKQEAIEEENRKKEEEKEQSRQKITTVLQDTPRQEVRKNLLDLPIHVIKKEEISPEKSKKPEETDRIKPPETTKPLSTKKFAPEENKPEENKKTQSPSSEKEPQ